MKSSPKIQRRLSGWLVLIPSLAIIALMVLLTPAPSSASQPDSTLTGVLPQAQQPGQPVCQSCHPEEYEAWKNTPHAISAGASCENCHGPYKEGHPDKSTMQLPMASDTCRTCHANTFKDWDTSSHAARNIECFDCHNAHTQGVRTGNADTLCAACHSDRTTELAHATHGINGIDCVRCHMATETLPAGSNEPTPTQGLLRSHTFKVASDVCAQCHEGTIHTSNTLVAAQAASAVAAGATTGQTSALNQQVTDLQNRLNSIGGAAAIGMGIALGIGGFVGLVLGIVGSALWMRRNS